jgi:hypothetical protein
VNDIEDLVSEFAGINVGAVGVVGDEGYVEGTDVWNVGEALEEVVLSPVSPFLRFKSRIETSKLTQSL